MCKVTYINNLNVAGAQGEASHPSRKTTPAGPSTIRKEQGTMSENVSSSKNKVFCNYCPGFCCYRLPGAILFVTAIDINRIARHFGLSDGEVRQRFIENRNTFKVKADGSCIFLLDGKLRRRCSIHKARPLQCSEFPYDDPCPYLGREELLRSIYPKMVKSLGCKSLDE